MKGVLGIDTSCYTSSVACVTPEGEILASERRLLSVPEGMRGLQQSQAVFQHVRRVPELMERMLASLPEPLVPVAVCVSVRPRPADDSYMPVFQVGAGYARMAAALYGIPYYETSHQQGHVRAAQVGTGLPLEQPLLVFHLSGGTTELLQAAGGAVRVVCETGDLHAGQLVDRIGVALGLPFPAGPMLEQLAVQGQARALIPVSVRGSVCHLSGAERQLMDLADQGTLSKQDRAAEVYSFLTRTIQRMIAEGVRRTGIPSVLLAGGVASSALLRNLLNARMAARQRTVRLWYAEPSLAGDNAVGVALLGRERHCGEEGAKRGLKCKSGGEN